MTYTTGLFYAYAKHSTTDWAWRYLITFANRDTADEWWRAVTDSVASGYKRFAGVQRVSHQFYIHNPDIDDGNIMKTLEDERCAKKFLGRVFFTLLNDRDGRVIDPAPVLNYTDYVSGNGFFIRSSLQNDLYWYFNGEQLVTSRTQRTKFTVRILREGNRGLVMIGTDTIAISVFNSDNVLRVQSNGELSVSSGGLGASIKFSDFDGGFQVGANGSLVCSSTGAGERWELV